MEDMSPWHCRSQNKWIKAELVDADASVLDADEILFLKVTPAPPPLRRKLPRKAKEASSSGKRRRLASDGVGFEAILPALPALASVLDRLPIRERVRLGRVSTACRHGVSLYFSATGKVDLDSVMQVPFPVKGTSYDSLLLERLLTGYRWFQSLPKPPSRLFSSKGTPVIWEPTFGAIPICLRRTVNLMELTKQKLPTDALPDLCRLALAVSKDDVRMAKPARAFVSSFFGSLSRLEALELSASPETLNIAALATAIRAEPSALARLAALSVPAAGPKTNKILPGLVKGLRKLRELSLVFPEPDVRDFEREKPEVTKWLRKSLDGEQRSQLASLRLVHAEPRDLPKFVSFAAAFLESLTTLRIRIENPNNLYRLAPLAQLETLEVDLGRVDNICVSSLSPITTLHTLIISFEFQSNSVMLICDLPIRKLDINVRNASSKHKLNISRLRWPFTETVEVLRLRGLAPGNFNRLGTAMRASTSLRRLDFLFAQNFALHHLADAVGAVGASLRALSLQLPPYDADFGGCMNLAGAFHQLIRRRSEEDAVSPIRLLQLVVMRQNILEVDFCRRQIKDLREVCRKSGVEMQLVLQDTS